MNLSNVKSVFKTCKEEAGHKYRNLHPRKNKSYELVSFSGIRVHRTRFYFLPEQSE